VVFERVPTGPLILRAMGGAAWPAVARQGSKSDSGRIPPLGISTVRHTVCGTLHYAMKCFCDFSGRIVFSKRRRRHEPIGCPGGFDANE
jgi:hypothetical protein